ncbi:MAG TPA: peptidoglycan DD-metalloendopeptidase family protein [Methylophilaceae bacterium]|nr:peptidoglycan DD-metalloendopeptidase family protein [Methylophilaceae bacterium]
MVKSRLWWVLFLVMTGCAAVEPAPVEERKPTPKPAVQKPATTDKAGGTTTQKGKDWRPDSYVVKRGDTLYSIGLEFGYDYREIAKINNINPPYSLYVGQRLDFKGLKSDGTGTPVAEVPSATETEDGVVITPLNTNGPLTVQPSDAMTQPAPAAVQTTTLPATVPVISQPKAVREPYSLQALNAPPPAPVQQPGSATVPAQPPTPLPQSAGTVTPGPTTPAQSAGTEEIAGTAAASEWAWPTQGKIIKGFSDTGSARGIDIAGTMGQPVMAAGPGKVIYSGQDLRGYGKLVIIKHDSNLLSVYAHNSKILVKEGQQVSKGQKIAEMGNTDADQVKLHFEIRQQGKSVDPMKYLTGSPG